MANVWNADDTWTIEVYENGVKTGEMERYKDLDAWGAGYHVGVLSANPDSHGKTTYDHFYRYTLKDAKAAVEIRATDCFGKVYTQNVFTQKRTIRWWTTILRSPNSRSGHSANFHLGLTPYPANAMSNLF